MKIVKKVEYVLRKPLRKKGEVGDIVKVTKGFGRYLESEGIAHRVNAEVLKSLEENKKQWKILEEVNEKAAQKLIEKIANMTLIIKKRVAQGDKLYDSVRPENVISAFNLQGIQLQQDQIKINNQIKKLGKYNIIIHAYGNYETTVELDVISEETTI